MKNGNWENSFFKKNAHIYMVGYFFAQVVPYLQCFELGLIVYFLKDLFYFYLCVCVHVS